MRSDFAGTISTLSQAVESLILSPNEARDIIDYNRREGGDEFVNPYTTSGQDIAKEEDSAEDEVEDEEEAASTLQNKKLQYSAVRAHLGNLIDVERKRILQFAGDASKFVSKVAAFYAKFEGNLGIAIEKVHGDKALAKKWCADSKFSVLLASECTAEELKARVEEELATFDGRLDKLIKSIIHEV
jgi:hypothetical protein